MARRCLCLRQRQENGLDDGTRDGYVIKAAIGSSAVGVICRHARSCEHGRPTRAQQGDHVGEGGSGGSHQRGTPRECTRPKLVHMRCNSGTAEIANAPDTLFRVPNKPKTPNRVIRVDDDLWRDYGAACETDGVTRSDDLRAYMLRKVKAWKRRQTAEIEEYSGA